MQFRDGLIQNLQVVQQKVGRVAFRPSLNEVRAVILCGGAFENADIETNSISQ